MTNTLDFILNGRASGDVAARLLSCNFDPGALRPFISDDGRPCITINSGRKDNKGEWIYDTIVTNAPALLRKDEWIMLDKAVIQAALPRLKAWSLLRGKPFTLTIPNGMGVSVLQHQTMSDIGDAQTDMDGVADGDNDRQLVGLANMPLPITHKDFDYTLRQTMVGRNMGTPIDVSHGAAAGRAVGEQVERLTLGTVSGYSYGGGAVYGYRTFPSRLTGTITDPTTGGWVPGTLITELLAGRQLSKDANHHGPWDLLFAPAWDEYLDEDHSAAKGDRTLRERIAAIPDFNAVQTVDYLPDFDIIMVESSGEVARAVDGMSLTTLQWETKGGLQLNFKAMAIWVPQCRADYNGNTGLVHLAVP